MYSTLPTDIETDLNETDLNEIDRLLVDLRDQKTKVITHINDHVKHYLKVTHDNG